MQLILKRLCSVSLATLLFSVMANASATHISEPILEETKTVYSLGEKIFIKGWISYNNQPAADVLVAFKVSYPDGLAALETSHPSDKNGQFKFEFDTTNQTAGKYAVTVTSHCLETHRSICSYNYQTLTIHVAE